MITAMDAGDTGMGIEMLNFNRVFWSTVSWLDHTGDFAGVASKSHWAQYEEGQELWALSHIYSDTQEHLARECAPVAWEQYLELVRPLFRIADQLETESYKMADMDGEEDEYEIRRQAIVSAKEIEYRYLRSRLVETLHAVFTMPAYEGRCIDLM